VDNEAIFPDDEPIITEECYRETEALQNFGEVGTVKLKTN